MVEESVLTLGVPELLQLDPTAFVEDLYNAAHCHCADAFDELDEAIRKDLATALSPAQQARIMEVTSSLYDQVRSSLTSQLQRFEEFALETCLRIPPGLVSSVQVDGPSVGGQIDPEEEASVQGKLVDLRKQIVAEKEAVRVVQRHIAACDAVLEPHASLDEGLRRLASAIQEKETLSGDMFVLSQSGTRLQSLLAELRKLTLEQPTSGPVESLKQLSRSVSAAQLDSIRESLTT